MTEPLMTLAAPVIDSADEKLVEGLRAILAERDGRELSEFPVWAFTNRATK